MDVSAWKAKIMDSKLHDKEHQLSYCETLLHHALAKKNKEDIAYAYLWMADYSYYVKRDMAGLDRYLKKAKAYLKMESSKDVIQYYTLKAMDNNTTYDLLSRLECYLQIIHHGKVIGDELSVVTANGNIAELFHLCHDYETALSYGINVYEQYRKLQNARDINKTILLTNIVELSCYVKDGEKAQAYIEALLQIKGTFVQYQLYLNICYLRYYAMKAMIENALQVERDLFKLLKQIDASLDTRYECLMIMIESMLTIRAAQQMLEAIHYLESIIAETDVNRWLQMQKMRIAYYTLIDDKEARKKQYRLYVKTYERIEKANQETKIKGIRATFEIQNIMRKEAVLRVNNRSLESESMVDMMTNLYNRRYFNTILSKLEQDETLRWLGFAIFDVDYFKEYNDVYGHLKGDQVLITIANILKNTNDERITPCRFGGDEFICIFTNMSDKEMESYIRSVVSELKTAALLHSASKSASIVTLSIGYGSQCIVKQFHHKQILEKIDQALYQSKRKGRDTYTKMIGAGDDYEE